MQPTLPISKSFWIRTVLLLLVFAPIISCEKDEIQYEEVEEKRAFTVETLTHRQASSNKQLLSSFENTKTLLSPIAAKSGVFHDTLNDLYILTDQVKHVITGDYESYTYGVEKNDGTNNLYNLLFSKQVDGSFKSILVTYDLSKVIEDQLDGGNLDDLDSGYVTFINISSSFSMKNDIFRESGEGDCITVTMSEGDCGFGGNHMAGDYCPSLETIIQENTRVWTIVRESCGSDGGGGPNADEGPDDPFSGDNGYPDNSGNPTNGSGANTDASNNNNNNDETPATCIYDNNDQCVGDVTSPVLPRLPLIVSPLTHDLFETLEVDEKNYINHPDQKQLRKQIDDFLLEEEHSEPAKDFAIEAIKAKREDEDTVVDLEQGYINNLTGRAKEIFNLLLASDPYFVNHLIEDNFNSNKESFLILTMADLSHLDEGIPAFTDLSYNVNNGEGRVHNIRIDALRINSLTNIEIAQIIIHEMLHTELMERSIQLGLFTQVETTTNTFIPAVSNLNINNIADAVFAYMVNNYIETSSTSSEWNHNAFTIENYRARIVEALLSVHENLSGESISLTNYPQNVRPRTSYNQMSMPEIFVYFSWNGLTETAEYLALPQDIKDRIIFVTERLNSTYPRSL